MDELAIFVKPLVLTIVFELVAAFIIGISQKKNLILVILVNVLTNPVLVLISSLLMYYLGIEIGQLLTYIILEPIVIFVEYHIFKRYLLVQRNPLVISLILNAVSILGGIICQTL